MKRIKFTFFMVIIAAISFNKSFAANPVDMTYHILNSSFEDNQSDRQPNIPSWIKSITGDDNFSTRSNNPSPDKFPTFVKDGNVYAQYWYPTELPPHQLSQELSGLPNGQYTLTAMVAVEVYPEPSDDLSGVYLFAGENRTPVIDKGGKDVIVHTTVTDGTLTIGYMVEELSNAKFVIIDNFRLAYDGAITNINQPNNGDIAVYPTITQGAVTVNTPWAAEIQLSDITGKILDSYNSVGGIYELNISNNSNGIYFITIITENGNTVYKVLKK
jgi:hypothetical protein